MDYSYKLMNDQMILRSDGAGIPIDPANADYAAYQAWLAEGNEPLPTASPEEALAAERAAMVCSRFQARAALHAAGLLAQVETAVAAADEFTKIAWADAVEFRRNSPTIAALSGAVGMTDTQIDDLFRAAMQIEA